MHNICHEYRVHTQYIFPESKEIVFRSHFWAKTYFDCQISYRGQEARDTFDGILKRIDNGRKGSAAAVVDGVEEQEEEEEEEGDAASDASGNTHRTEESGKSGRTYNSDEPADAVVAEPEIAVTVLAPAGLDVSTVPLIGSLLAGSSGNEEREARNVSVLVDKLSGLFYSISSICQEQFVVIRKIFSRNMATRMIRSLISSFFDDPQFGLCCRIEMVSMLP